MLAGLLKQVNMRSVLFCLLVVFFFHGEVASQKFSLVSFKTIDIRCYGNPDLLVNITCRLKPINWQKTIAVMDSDLVGVIRNVSFHIQLFKYTHTNQFRPFFLNVTTNICNMLGTGSGNPYAKVAVKLFKRFTNINHKCPYSGHLEAREIYIDSDALPFGLPSGKYKLKMSFHEGWPMVYIGTVELTISVIEDATRRTDSSTRKEPKTNRGSFVRRKRLIRSTAVQKFRSQL